MIRRNLIDINQKVRELRVSVSDAEWNSDPIEPVLRKQLEHFEQLQREGKLYEPMF